MKFLIFITYFMLMLISDFSFAETVELMGCEWQVPDRFAKDGNNTWYSRSGEASAIYFKNNFFDEEIVGGSIEPRVLIQKILFSQKSNGYEITFYVEYLVNNENFTLPSWVVIKRLSEKGVFYLRGLGLEEISEFVNPCMPDLK